MGEPTTNTGQYYPSRETLMILDLTPTPMGIYWGLSVLLVRLKSVFSGCALGGGGQNEELDSPQPESHSDHGCEGSRRPRHRRVVTLRSFSISSQS